MKMLPILVFLVMLNGCHTQAPRVKCDRPLEPINTPAPVVTEPATTSATPP
jgi:hypothetical protein